MRYLTVLTLLIFSISLMFSETYITDSVVSGTWLRANEPYYVMNEITVPEGQILTVEPGVHVIVTGLNKININGALRAIGTSSEMIEFTAADTTLGWHGLHFNQATSEPDSSIVEYCRLTYGKSPDGVYELTSDNNGGAITALYRNELRISSCIISRCHSGGSGGGISAIYSLLRLNSNSIIYNEAYQRGGGVFYSQTAGAILDNLISNNRVILNSIPNNGGGINAALGSSYGSLKIKGNRISNNYAYRGGGVFLGGFDIYMDHNVICNNAAVLQGAIFLTGSTSNSIKNCIVWGNTYPPYLLYSSSLINYNDMQDYSGGTGNISTDPLFVFPSAGAGADFDGASADWRISYNSPCLDTGDPASALNADGTRTDIGCFPYLHRALFLPSLVFCTAGDTVTFANLSFGYDLPEATVAWDLGNDGTTDATSYDWSHLFDTPGVYSVMLRETVGALADSCLRTLVVQAEQLPPPENLTADYSGNDVVLGWDPVTETTAHQPVTVHFYVILYSPDPYGTFEYLGTSAYDATCFTHTDAQLVAKGFYRVIGFAGTDRELEIMLRTFQGAQNIRTR